MSRIYSSAEDNQKPKIDKLAVNTFFSLRARRINSLGAVQAVIYQDKHPELAMRRDLAEKEKLLPQLYMNGTQRILDVGCGTGRWVKDLLPVCSYYHGIDSCASFIDYAKENFSHDKKANFTTAAIEDFSLKKLRENLPFDRVLCCGVMIYLNDQEVRDAVSCMASVLHEKEGILLCREPIGIDHRLTVLNHYSDEMEQTYNAIYRTENELISFLCNDGYFRVIEIGFVYDDSSLNNRSDTIQKYFLLEKL